MLFTTKPVERHLPAGVRVVGPPSQGLRSRADAANAIETRAWLRNSTLNKWPTILPRRLLHVYNIKRLIGLFIRRAVATLPHLEGISTVRHEYERTAARLHGRDTLGKRTIIAWPPCDGRHRTAFLAVQHKSPQKT
jgi:hypothetical protein